MLITLKIIRITVSIPLGLLFFVDQLGPYRFLNNNTLYTAED